MIYIPMAEGGFPAVGGVNYPSVPCDTSRPRRDTLPHRAEGAGFEPAIPYGMPPFQGGALDRYATLPLCGVILGNPSLADKFNNFLNASPL